MIQEFVLKDEYTLYYDGNNRQFNIDSPNGKNCGGFTHWGDELFTTLIAKSIVEGANAFCKKNYGANNLCSQRYEFLLTLFEGVES